MKVIIGTEEIVVVCEKNDFYNIAAAVKTLSNRTMEGDSSFMNTAKKLETAIQSEINLYKSKGNK